MKKLALLLGIVSCFAQAGEGHQPQGSNSFAASEAFAKSLSSSGANSQSSAGSASVNVNNDVAASSTVTGSSNTTANCWRYDSTSGSIIIAGLTKTLMVRDLVCTLDKPLNTEQKIALCLENSDYRKLRNIQHAADASIASCTK